MNWLRKFFKQGEASFGMEKCKKSNKDMTHEKQ
jgi:hypothetical protein